MAGGDAAHTATAAGPPPPYRQAWATRVDESGPIAGPVVAGDSVVVVGPDGVAALAADTGKVQWKRPRTPGPIAPAAIEKELVLYAEGNDARSAVVAAPLDGGEEVWRLPTGSPMVGGATVAGGAAYLSGRNGKVYAVVVETGDREWTFEAAGRVATPPAVSNGTVLVIAEGFKSGRATVHALDARTGEEEWRFSPDRVTVGASALTVADDTVVFGLGDLRVYALDLRTGRERWSARSRAPFSPGMAPSFDDDVLIGDQLGRLYRLTAASGEERWVFRLPGNLLTGSPAVAGETGVIGDESGQISAIDLRAGHLVWKEQLSRTAVSSVAIAEDRIYVASDGRVVSLAGDREGVLLDEPSPTTLFWGRAILNFAVAFAALLFGILAMFRWILRGRVERPGQAGSSN
jgi:outer membrane protein assembly factor BamB